MLLSAQCRTFLFPKKPHLIPLRDYDADAIYVNDDTRIQILETMSELPRADKEQCGAFIVRWFHMPLSHHSFMSSL